MDVRPPRMEELHGRRTFDRKASLEPEAIGPEAIRDLSPPKTGAVTLKKNLDRKASHGPEAIKDVSPPTMGAVTSKKNFDEWRQ